MKTKCKRLKVTKKMLDFIALFFSEDPCKRVKCGHGEICVVDGHKGRCFCPRRCLNQRIQQVCGTDGISYKNYCYLMRTACIIGDKTLKKVHDGRCGSKPHSKPPILSTPKNELSSTGKIIC